MSTKNISNFSVMLCLLGLIALFLMAGTLYAFPADRQVASVPAAAPQQSDDNPIVIENQLPGTSNWELKNPAQNQEIEGYASKTSINQGESIDFYVNTIGETYTFEIYRMGWYGGLGGRLVYGPDVLEGTIQEIPRPEEGTNFYEADWINPVTVTTDENWVTGMYVVKLISSANKERYIPFTVREDDRKADLLFQTSVATWQAYNNWGGYSLYDFNSLNEDSARVVSFNRPYSENNGAGRFFRWEYNLIRWLEKEGYDVSYITTIDVHESYERIEGHKAFLSVGHDEYHSWELRQNLERYVDEGHDVAFLTGGEMLWVSRFEPSRVDGEPNRTMVGYKARALEEDPIYLDDDPSNDYMTTSEFRDPPQNYPEGLFIGIQYGLFPIIDQDITVINTDHWAYEDTGLSDGDVIKGILGYEIDIYEPGLFQGELTFLSDSIVFEDDDTPDEGNHRMTIYQNESGGYVFAAGTIQYSWVLDNLGVEDRVEIDPRLEQFTRNIFARFINPDNIIEPTKTPTPGPSPTPTLTPVPPTGQLVFDDAVSSSWSIENSWNTTFAPFTTNPRYSGDSALGVEWTGSPGTDFRTFDGSLLSINEFDTLVFYINSQDNPFDMRVYLLDQEAGEYGYEVVSVAGNGWERIEVPLAGIELPEYIGFRIKKNSSDDEVPFFVIDQVELTNANNIVSTPPESPTETEEAPAATATPTAESGTSEEPTPAAEVEPTEPTEVTEVAETATPEAPTEAASPTEDPPTETPVPTETATAEPTATLTPEAPTPTEVVAEATEVAAVDTTDEEESFNPPELLPADDDSGRSTLVNILIGVFSVLILGAIGVGLYLRNQGQGNDL